MLPGRRSTFSAMGLLVGAFGPACGAASERPPTAFVPPPVVPPPAPLEPLGPKEPRAIDVTVGAYHTCVLLAEGTVRCAGHNDHGQLGTGAFDGKSHPVLTPLANLTGVKEIAAGWTHTCAIVAGGEVRCWGDDNVVLTGAPKRGGLGWGWPKVKPIDGVKARALNRSMGVYRTLALSREGRLVSWGYDEDGPDRCDSTRRCAKAPMTHPVPAGTVGVAGTEHTLCVWTEAGEVHCRGYDHQTLQRVEGLPPIATVRGAVARGDEHACAVTQTGEVWCWGNDDEGQLGRGGGRRDPAPAPVVSLPAAAREVVIAFKHTCARLADATVACWGDSVGPDGEWRRSAKADVPVRVEGLRDVARIVTATSHHCALKKNGRVVCWGQNEDGAVADGTMENRPRPVRVAYEAPPPPEMPKPDTSVRATQIALANDHGCAVTSERELRCWGSNRSGQLGIGQSDDAPHPVPVKVPLKDVSAVTVASGFTCAISAGRPFCWGRDEDGRLGHGANGSRAAPTPVAGLPSVEGLHAGWNHVCARVRGQVRCWGAATGGMLGVSAPTCPSQPPSWLGQNPNAPPHICALSPGAPVTGLPPLRRVVAGIRATAAVAEDGRLFTWGTGVLGQLGTGQDGEQPPARVPVLGDVVDVGFGNQHACALERDGRVYCWGSHRFGQVGRGPIGGRRPIPLAVKGVTAATALAVGDMSACAVTDAGDAMCWGSMVTTGHVSGIWREPTKVPGLPPVQAMAIGWSNACALARDGSVWCWGYGTSGVQGLDHDRTATPTPLRWR